jgi:hypothetical protein
VSLVLARLSGDGLVERQGSTLIIAPPGRLIERLEVPVMSEELVLAGLGDHPQLADSRELH